MASLIHRQAKSRGASKGLRGTTLFETVVAVFIFSILILGVCLALFTEAGRRIGHSGVRAGDPAAERVLDRIRTDVWNSSSFVIPPDYDYYATWYEGPLVLAGHVGGHQLGYGVDGGVLHRAVQIAGEEEPVVSEILRDVETFRWRILDETPRAVELEILRSEADSFRGPDGAAAGRTPVADRIVLLPRRVQSTRW